MTKLASLKQIDLIASDFDVILKSGYIKNGEDYSKFCNQYTEGDDCPIARSLKRQGFIDVKVSPNRVITDGEKRHIHGGFKNVLDACIAIGMGAESSSIHFGLKS